MKERPLIPAADMLARLEAAAWTRGLGLAPETLAQLARYVELLAAANRRFNLTAIRDAAGMEQLHLCDSLMLLPFVDRAPAGPLLDVGSGAGLPGLPLAIARPGRRICLLESMTRRADFLRGTAADLGLGNIRVIAARAEEAAHDPGLRERFALVTARAVAPLGTLVELCVPYLQPDGIFVAMKSADPDELAAAERAIQALRVRLAERQDYEIPGAGKPRCLLVFRRTGSLPQRFPRPLAQIRRGPP
ncbi:MAG: 16S rRNA (guanine(527)-N(7))-methyltransferase RsmG [Bacillota bacterium]|nr:16S rRNA (guanine(527)-N(7))-methyltransferase RsmG [Bacillota bacterium]